MYFYGLLQSIQLFDMVLSSSRLFAPWIREAPFGTQIPEGKRGCTTPSGRRVWSVQSEHILARLLMK